LGKTAAGIFDEPARDGNSTGLTVSPRPPTEPAVLAEQVERTSQRSAGPIPGDSVPGGTIQNQQLVFKQNGLGENGPHASGPRETNRSGEDMDE
jgi:hypothetical protein